MVRADNLYNEAWLIERGIRPMCLLNSHHEIAGLSLSEIKEKFTDAAKTFEHVVPFVVKNEAGDIECGFATNKWVIDTYLWLLNEAPTPHYHRMLGLLLGYSPRSIQEFTDRLERCPVI